MTPTEELLVATAIAQSAGENCLSFFRADNLDARLKGARDLVTAADFASENLIKSQLREEFPGDGLVGEEGSREASGTGRTWFVDPLDGTLNFAHGIPFWCVSLTLFEGPIPILGVVHDPIHAETFSALKGAGACCNGVAISGSAVNRPDDALVHVTVDFADIGLRAGLDDIAVLAPSVLRTRNLGSAALGLAYVGAGRLDAMVHRLAHTWDFGAGMLIVSEAGGKTSDIDGNTYTVNSTSVCAAATPKLHGRLLELLRSPECPPLQ